MLEMYRCEGSAGMSVRLVMVNVLLLPECVLFVEYGCRLIEICHAGNHTVSVVIVCAMLSQFQCMHASLSTPYALPISVVGSGRDI